MMKTEAQLRAEIENAKAELARKEEELASRANQTEEQRLAEELHAMLCRQDHTEGCSWGYEVSGSGKGWDSGYTHGEYLKRAQSVLEIVDAETALEVLTAAKANK